MIGSDEELAFRASVKKCFHGATHVLCTRHLKANTLKQLDEKCGYPLKDRQSIVQQIFEENGVIGTADEDCFNERVRRVREEIKQKDDVSMGKDFMPYFDGKLLPLIQKHIILPARQGKIPFNWTSNNSESANHILKTSAEWKLQDVPSFILSWQTIVESEFSERARAIRDFGNYKLHQSFGHHFVPICTWSTMSNEQHAKRVSRFRSDKGRSHVNEVTSTNGQRTVIRTPSAGKKPNQCKRKRAERSRTPASKRRLVVNE